MSVALLVLRVIVGALFAGHGSQKLFGWFRGHGLKPTGSYFESIGLTPGVLLAFVAGLAELAGGLLLGFGLLVPVACALLVAVMTTATAVVMSAVAFAVTAIGAGRYSLGNAFGIDWASVEWAIIATALGVVGGLIAVAVAHWSHDHQTHSVQPHTA